MLLQQDKVQLTHLTIHSLATIVLFMAKPVNCIFFTRGGSFGYLAAVAMPLDLPNRNVYMAFNFEANYGLPSNDSYNEWIDRWDIDEQFVGIGNNVTAINNRKRRVASAGPRYDRHSFYRSFTGYLDHYEMNGTACLLRTICEVAASSLHENNGVLGSIFKILFMLQVHTFISFVAKGTSQQFICKYSHTNQMSDNYSFGPTTSRPESTPLHHQMADEDLYRAEWKGRQYLGSNYAEGQDEHDVVANACMDYTYWCPEGVINMISTWY